LYSVVVLKNIVVCNSKLILWGRVVALQLRHYTTNRQVAGSISDAFIGIFQWHIPSGCTMALGSSQPLREMSTSCIFWG